MVFSSFFGSLSYANDYFLSVAVARSSQLHLLSNFDPMFTSCTKGQSFVDSCDVANALNYAISVMYNFMPNSC